MSDGLDVFFGDPTAEEDDDTSTAVKAEPTESQNQRDTSSQDEFPDAVFKKWYRTKDKSGFLTLDTWLEAGKVSLDIGEVIGDQTNNTKVWCDAMAFATYLRAVTNGTAERIYPKRSGLSTPESFINYGGGEMEGRKVSRILKVVYWGSEDRGYDSSAFNYKAGHFAATTNAQGAYIPNMQEVLSVNMIKMSRSEVAEMSFRLDIALQRFAIMYDGDAFRAFNGNVER